MLETPRAASSFAIETEPHLSDGAATLFLSRDRQGAVLTEPRHCYLAATA